MLFLQVEQGMILLGVDPTAAKSLSDAGISGNDLVNLTPEQINAAGVTDPIQVQKILAAAAQLSGSPLTVVPSLTLNSSLPSMTSPTNGAANVDPTGPVVFVFPFPGTDASRVHFLNVQVGTLRTSTESAWTLVKSLLLALW